TASIDDDPNPALYEAAVDLVSEVDDGAMHEVALAATVVPGQTRPDEVGLADGSADAEELEDVTTTEPPGTAKTTSEDAPVRLDEVLAAELVDSDEAVHTTAVEPELADSAVGPAASETQVRLERLLGLGASVLHFSPNEGVYRVRARLDGIVREA